MPANLSDHALPLLIALGVIVSAVVGYLRRRRDLRRYLEPPLRDRGMQFVDATVPRLFRTGPFPKIEFRRTRFSSNILGIRGEASAYRIVRFRDASHDIHQVWAVVETELFRLKRVRWRAERKETLPETIQSLLEN